MNFICRRSSLSQSLLMCLQSFYDIIVIVSEVMLNHRENINSQPSYHGFFPSLHFFFFLSCVLALQVNLLLNCINELPINAHFAVLWIKSFDKSVYFIAFDYSSFSNAHSTLAQSVVTIVGELNKKKSIIVPYWRCLNFSSLNQTISWLELLFWTEKNHSK